MKALVNLAEQKDVKWVTAGQGWEGITSSLKLQGWSKERRLVVLRKLLVRKGEVVKVKIKKKNMVNPNQPFFPAIKGFDWGDRIGMVRYE